MRYAPWASTRFSWLVVTTLLVATCLSCQERATWESHWEKGSVYFQQRDFMHAEAELRSALKLAEAEKQYSSKVTRSILGLGILYDAQRRYDEAQQLFERAVQLIEKTAGADHSDLIMPLNYLGALHGIQHHFDRALPYYERVLSIQERSLGPAQSLTSEHIKHIAILHASRAQYQEAEAFLSRVLELPKTSPETTDKKTVEYLDNYTRLHTAQEEYSKAKPYLDEFDPVDGGLMPSHLNGLSASLVRLTNLLASQDKFVNAESQLRRTVEETEKAQGPMGLGVAQALSALADLYWAWDKVDTAIPLMERSLAIARRSGSQDSGNSLPTLMTTRAAQTQKQPADTISGATHLAALRRANQAALQRALTK